MKNFKLRVLGLILIFLLLGCKSDDLAHNQIIVDNQNKSNTQQLLKTDTNTSNEKIHVLSYFSINSSTFSQGADDKIIDDINNAKKSIFLVMYDFSNKKIKEALLDAHDRNIHIEIITDDKKINGDIYQNLLDKGLSVSKDDDSVSLVHDKYIIIDDTIVWTGSTNFTYYAFYKNSENVLRIYDTNVSSCYNYDFLMIEKNINNSHPCSIKNSKILFSPYDNIKNEIISVIDKAKSSINFLMFAFTDGDIASALKDAQERGVKVSGVMDKAQNDYQTYSKYQWMIDNGLNVKLNDDNKLHDKFIVVDDLLVATGSFNFTKKANTKNRENYIFIKDVNLSAKFQDEFNKIYNK